MSETGTSVSEFHFAPEVLHVAAELAPHAKTGGLGDMVSSIAKAVAEQGARCTVLLPAYDGLRGVTTAEQILDLGSPLGERCQLILARQGRVRLAMVRCDLLFSRPGGIYADSSGIPWPDNAVRFGLLGKVAAMIAGGCTVLPPPDIIHLHDWHPGLYFAFSPPSGVPTVLTIHNFAFQGRFDDACLTTLSPFADIPIIQSGRYFGGYSPLKIASDRADIITTVSEGYRQELQSPTRSNWFQLSTHNRGRLRAIQNWMDRTEWDPSSDQALVQAFDDRTLALRTANRTHLAAKLGFRPELPIACTVSRLTGPKGFNFLLNNLDVVSSAMGLVFVGDGEPKLLRRIRQAATHSPDRIKLVTPYTEAAARQTLAGADFLLMPSLVEPSGLTQMHAQAYGCVPIVSETGGLTASIGNAGFLFRPSDRQSLQRAVKDALSLFRSPSAWRAVQARGMQKRLDEGEGPRRYMQCYAELLAQRSEKRTCERSAAPAPVQCLSRNSAEH